jgi:hypothetical protein
LGYCLARDETQVRNSVRPSKNAITDPGFGAEG